MTSQIIPVDPFDFIIFGGTGDLSERKLLPALYHRQRDHQFSEPTRIIGTSRSKLTDEEFRAFARKAISEHVEARVHRQEGSRDLHQPTELCFGRRQHRRRVCQAEEGDRRQQGDPRLLSRGGAGAFRRHFSASSRNTIWSRPIRASWWKSRSDGIWRRRRRSTTRSATVFGEHQIFRIDHYLGKETVQNLMALRFANALYEPLWNSAHIDHVQITVAETVGLEDRVTYYDKAGALRDMVQNHMLQLLCLVAMEPPSSMDANAVRDEKLKVLRSLKRINGQEAPKSTVRGQYRAGASSGGAVKGYLEELGSKDSTTETFVAVKADIANWRWAGVPFYLRTGKRLATRVSEIVIEFKPIPHSIFGESAGNVLRQPARDPAAAGRGRQAVHHDQGSRPGRHAAQADPARHDLRAELRRALARRL